VSWLQWPNSLTFYNEFNCDSVRVTRIKNLIITRHIALMYNQILMTCMTRNMWNSARKRLISIKYYSYILKKYFKKWLVLTQEMVPSLVLLTEKLQPSWLLLTIKCKAYFYKADIFYVSVLVTSKEKPWRRNMLRHHLSYHYLFRGANSFLRA